MSINAEIDATVAAFVAELLTLVRAAALEHVRAALGPSQAPAPTPPGAARARSAGDRSRKAGHPAEGPRAFRDGHSAEGPTRARVPARAPARSSAPQTSRSSELKVSATRVEIPVSVRVAPPPPRPPVVVQRIPPKRTRVARTLPPPAPAPAATRSADETAKKWVVVRRPARAHDSSAPPAADAALEGVSPVAPPPLPAPKPAEVAPSPRPVAAPAAESAAPVSAKAPVAKPSAPGKAPASVKPRSQR